MTQLWLWLERQLEALTGRKPPGCCEGCAGGAECEGAAPAEQGYGKYRHRRTSGTPRWSSWSWHGRMVLDAEHWRPRPIPRGALPVPEWALNQEAAAAQHVNLAGRHYLTMPLTYKAGRPLAEIYGENLTAPRPFGYPQPTPSATWSAPPIGLISSR